MNVIDKYPCGKVPEIMLVLDWIMKVPKLTSAEIAWSLNMPRENASSACCSLMSDNLIEPDGIRQCSVSKRPMVQYIANDYAIDDYLSCIDSMEK